MNVSSRTENRQEHTAAIKRFDTTNNVVIVGLVRYHLSSELMKNVRRHFVAGQVVLVEYVGINTAKAFVNRDENDYTKRLLMH